MGIASIIWLIISTCFGSAVGYFGASAPWLGAFVGLAIGICVLGCVHSNGDFLGVLDAVTDCIDD